MQNNLQMKEEIWDMNSSKYKDWVQSIKEGDLVLILENNAIYSSPVIFLNWNGDSSSNGHRAQHLYIPDWNVDHFHFQRDDNPQEALNKQWESVFENLEKYGIRSVHFDASSVNARAEQRYFPFPKEFLTENQKKFIKLINKIKGYEY